MIGNVIYCALYALNYTVLTLFLVFRCFTVINNRKKCFWIVLSFSSFLFTLEYILEFMFESQGMTEMYVAYTISHSIYTFALLGAIGIFAEGYLPRNYILLTFYCDIITIAIGMLGIYDLPIAFAKDWMDISPSVYEAHSIYDILLIIPFFISTIVIIIVSLLFNKKITSLIRKIPDRICFIVLSVSFILYIIKSILSCLQYDLFSSFEKDSIFNESLLKLTLTLIVLTVIILVLLLDLSQNRLRYNKLLSLEKQLQYEYYSNVSMIHGKIRNLKHDLSNHIAAMEYLNSSNIKYRKEYIQSLHGICNDIDKRTDSHVQWQNIETDLLSNREKYEIYQYVISVQNKYGQLDLKVNENNNVTNIIVELQQPKTKILKIWKLKRLPLYGLTSTIAKAHNGKAVWTVDDATFTLTISIK